MRWPALVSPIALDEPIGLWLGLLAPILIAATWKSVRSLEPSRQRFALATRSVLILLAACCLAGVQLVDLNKDLTVIFVLDRSASVEGLGRAGEEFIHDAAGSMPPADRLGLIDFAQRAYVHQIPMTGGCFVQPGRLPPVPDPNRTNLAAALRLAMAMFPYDSDKRALTAKRIVLLTDGHENLGDVLNEARGIRADGVAVDVVPLRYSGVNEVFFERVLAPTHVEPGEQVTLRLILRTSRRVSGRLIAYHNDRLVEMPPERSRVELRPGSNTFYVKLTVDSVTDQTYRFVFHPDDARLDSHAANNVAEAFSFVSGPSRVLLISMDPAFDGVLHDALLREGVYARMSTPADLGGFDLRQMSAYAAIIMANVPAAVFTEAQQRMMAHYVRDLGGGLIMLGGDEGFGAGGWIGTPVAEVLPVDLEIKHKRILPRGALVLIMHSSEAPSGNSYAKQMAKKSLDTISSRDYLGVLAYSFSPQGHNWEVPLDVATNKPAIKALIDKMDVGDMPDFETTMQMALTELTAGRARDAAQRHVIIFSDGDPTPPSLGLLRAYREARVTVSTVAIGWGAHVEVRTMREIARQTGGTYYDAKDPKRLPMIFSKESKIVRRPLIVNEPFEPQVAIHHSELLAGLDAPQERMPPLGGLVLTAPKNDPNVQVPIVRRTDDGDDPLLAHWQVELGKVVAFTSGYWPVWGEQWTRWPKFAKLWAQFVRWSMRQEAPAEFDAHTRIEGNRARIVVDALDKDASYLDNLQLEGNIVDPNGTSMPIRLVQTGPGHYEAEFEAQHSGHYLAGIKARRVDRDWGVIRTGLTVPTSPELRNLTLNEPLLRQVAELTGGRWLEGPDAAKLVFADRPPPVRAKRPAWDWVLAWLILPIWLTDVAVRRLANWLALSIVVELIVLVVLLFGLNLVYGTMWSLLAAVLLAELVGWAMRFRYIGPAFEYLTYPVVALGHAGEHSTRSVGRLKSVRARIRQGLKPGKEIAGPPRADSGEKRTDQDSEARLPTASGDGAVGPAEPLQEQPRPGTDTGSAVRKTSSGEKPEGAEEADATSLSRLLKAKRRARQERDRENDRTENDGAD